jgi:hypothetical protein
MSASSLTNITLKNVLVFFEFAEIVAGGSKNFKIDDFFATFFAKLIDKTSNRLALVVKITITKKLMGGGSRNLDFFCFILQQFSCQLLHLKIFQLF